MNKTQIEWVKNPDGTQGYTWNVITGCLNHTNGMCKGGNFPCYAYRLATTRLRERYLANLTIASPISGLDFNEMHQSFADPFYPRFWPERIPKDRTSIYEPTPKGIFVCDMSDLFGVGIPEKWQEQVFRVIRYNRWHRFYLLTKRPENLPKWSPFPSNCFVGVTATNQKMFDEAVKYLGEIEATVKFISFEPLLSHIIIDKQH